MSGASTRLGNSSDIEAAVSVWKSSDTARRGGKAAPPGHEKSARSHLKNPDSFLLIAEGAGGDIVGVACGTPGLADDGAGPKVDGLCHVGMVFVAPGRWGEGIGNMLVDATLGEARSRGYKEAQLWTHKDNERAKRLYENYGFERSGREMKDDLGEWIFHYERDL
ncbi:MAG: GNAT family N-acetyltransferase [Actinomycetota bacterium]|nr:GNAT family N-acetyltransferase [Rubrobacter sp.]MDQ3509085.1 GNAT family N-acetyltransferase [Actinomycetota bacterium]